MTKREFFTPPEVRALLGVAHDKVLGWIHSGELRAVDLSTTRGQRPRWRISQQALEDFLSRRAASPAPKPRRRRRQHNAGVTEFY